MTEFVPVLEMLNAAFPREASEWLRDERQIGLVTLENTTIAAGTELTHFYGKRTNQYYLLYYGFVPGAANAPNNYLRVDWLDLLGPDLAPVVLANEEPLPAAERWKLKVFQEQGIELKTGGMEQEQAGPCSDYFMTFARIWTFAGTAAEARAERAAWHQKRFRSCEREYVRA